MEVHIKRSVHITVTVDASFKKKYIVLVSRLIEELRHQLRAITISADDLAADDPYRAFLTQRMFETRLKVDQLMHQIATVKACKDGEDFTLSRLEGYTTLNEGQAFLSNLIPVVVHVSNDQVTTISG